MQSMIESFAEAWVAANTQTPLTEAAALDSGLAAAAAAGSNLDAVSSQGMSTHFSQHLNSDFRTYTS